MRCRLSTFNEHLIRNQRNKLAVRRFFIPRIYLHTEDLIDVFDLSLVPSHFDGVANGALHFACGSTKAFRHFGIKALGDAVDDLGIDYGHLDDGQAVKILKAHQKSLKKN